MARKFQNYYFLSFEMTSFCGLSAYNARDFVSIANMFKIFEIFN